MSDPLDRLRNNMDKTSRALRSGDWSELTDVQQDALRALLAQNEQVIKDLVKTVGPEYLKADQAGKDRLRLIGQTIGWWEDFEKELTKNPPQSQPDGGDGRSEPGGAPFTDQDSASPAGLAPA